MKHEWLNTVIKLGIPGALAVFLVWWMTGEFSVRLRAIEAQHVSMIGHSERVEDLMGRTYMSNERVLFVLRVMCANEAKSAEARRMCLENGTR